MTLTSSSSGHVTCVSGSACFDALTEKELLYVMSESNQFGHPGCPKGSHMDHCITRNGEGGFED